MSRLPVQPSLRRMAAFGVRPNRELGQNFLIDSNLLDVIARAAGLGPEDVVLEVAASTLTERGATRADDRISEAAMEDRKKDGYF